MSGERVADGEPTTDAGAVGVVFAAGSGTRLRPLTDLRPKALCPVDRIPLLDRTLSRVRPVVSSVAVNVWHLRDLIQEHLAGTGVHLSVEAPEALETAGALGQLRGWIAGRDVLACNADVYHPEDLAWFVEGWDRERVRLLTVEDPGRGDFGDLRYTGAALLPWTIVRELPAERLGLYPAVLAPHHERGVLDLVVSRVDFHDCGTPAEYLDANLAASGGHSVIGEGAVVEGEVVRSVLWEGVHVGPDERLVEAIRATDDVTVRVER